MRKTILLAVLCFVGVASVAEMRGQGTAAEQRGHDRDPDSELRDDLTYSMVAVWIGRQKKLSAEQLVTLADEWQGNLRSGIGETETDSGFKRSFSALCLSVLAERDLKDPFLGESRYRALLDASLTYLGGERDLRGFDAKKGWIHATAHTADLLAALAENKLFTKQDQERVLKAIAQRLATANEIFSYGEQDRLANVAAAIASRDDFDSSGWNSWIAQIDKEDKVVWQGSPPKMQALARYENDSYFMGATVAQISLRPTTSGSAEAQKSLLILLRHR